MIYAIIKVVVPEELEEVIGSTEYYIINNQYVGYADFNHIDTHIGLTSGEDFYNLFRKSTYTPVALVFPKGRNQEETLHKMNCDHKPRLKMTEKEAYSLLSDHSFCELEEVRYTIHQPNKNSSKVVLLSEDGDKVEDFRDLL